MNFISVGESSLGTLQQTSSSGASHGEKKPQQRNLLPSPEHVHHRAVERASTLLQGMLNPPQQRAKQRFS